MPDDQIPRCTAPDGWAKELFASFTQRLGLLHEIASFVCDLAADPKAREYAPMTIDLAIALIDFVDYFNKTYAERLFMPDGDVDQDALNTVEFRLTPLRLLAALTIEGFGCIPEASLPMTPGVACGIHDLCREFQRIETVLNEQWERAA